MSIIFYRYSLVFILLYIIKCLLYRYNIIRLRMQSKRTTFIIWNCQWKLWNAFSKSIKAMYLLLLNPSLQSNNTFSAVMDLLDPIRDLNSNRLSLKFCQYFVSFSLLLYGVRQSQNVYVVFFYNDLISCNLPILKRSITSSLPNFISCFILWDFGWIILWIILSWIIWSGLLHSSLPLDRAFRIPWSVAS